MDCFDSCWIYPLLIVIVAVVAGIVNHVQGKKDAEENTSGSSEYIYKRFESPNEFGRTNMDRFFIECVLSNATDFSKKATVEKAKLLANKYNLPYSSIEELYLNAYEQHKPLSQKYIQAEENKVRNAERQEYNKLTQYSSLHGKDKKLAMLRDQRDTLLSQAKSSETYADFMIRTTQQAEADWALLGGIANGLGGVGAGISTAIDVQARNAEIRAQNAANMRAVMPAYMYVTGSASQNRANAKQIEEEIQRTEMKLVEDISAKKVMELIEITDTTVAISKTGSFKITASISAKDGLTIYDDVPAYIDGTICASLYDGNTKVASALMVLPLNGISTRKVGIVGMGLSGAKENKTYTIKFTAHKLWLMEK